MKIDKAKLTKALSQIGIFVGKGTVDKAVSLVHFRNESKKATIFATDFFSAGRAYFDTDEDDVFEFCVEYSELLQTVRARGEMLDAQVYEGLENERGEKIRGIEFTDGKSKFNWALHDVDSLKAQEDATTIPENVPYFDIDAKTLKNAVRAAAFARNEKETQTPYITGVNFVGSGSDISMFSTDRHRVAGWKTPNPETLEGMEAENVNVTMSSKTISSIGLYDDDEQIRMYMTDSKIVLVSGSLEAYATRLICNFPNISSMFEKEVISSYSVPTKELKESIEIVNTKGGTILLNFSEDHVDIVSTRAGGCGNSNDSLACTRTKGVDESILLKPENMLDVLKSSDDDSIAIEFREMGNGYKMMSYRFDSGAYGMIAPMKK